MDPDALIAEVRSLVFDRLAQAGDADARKVAEAERRSQESNAWREFLVGVLNNQSTFAQQTAVAHADPEGWTAVSRDEQIAADIDTDAQVQRLDGLFAGARTPG